MRTSAIILSAGNGSRMNSKIKKQYLLLNGKPIIWHTLKAFQESDIDEIVLVTGEEERAYCADLVKESGFTKVGHIVIGGKERYDSVYAGLMMTEDSDYVLVHDGARPFISIETIHDSIEKVKECKACIVAVRVKDTIKKVDDAGVVTETPERNQLWAVQTPQSFERKLLKASYDQMMQDDCGGITDDAMVVEKYSNQKIYVIEGTYTNIKITTPEDLYTAEKFFEKSQKKC